jgi:hypothetical protein
VGPLNHQSAKVHTADGFKEIGSPPHQRSKDCLHFVLNLATKLNALSIFMCRTDWVFLKCQSDGISTQLHTQNCPLISSTVSKFTEESKGIQLLRVLLTINVNQSSVMKDGLAQY